MIMEQSCDSFHTAVSRLSIHTTALPSLPSFSARKENSIPSQRLPQHEPKLQSDSKLKVEEVVTTGRIEDSAIDLTTSIHFSPTPQSRYSADTNVTIATQSKIPHSKFCCPEQNIPTSCPSSRVLTLFLKALQTAIWSSKRSPALFHAYPADRPLPRAVIELKTVTQEANINRSFSYAYFAMLPDRDRGTVQICPTDNFGAVSIPRVEERRGRRVVYDSGRKEGALKSNDEQESAPLTLEWLEQDTIMKEGAFWKCQNCGQCSYWVRLVNLSADEGGKENEKRVLG